MITGKNHIGNELKAAGSSTYRTLNPQTNEVNPWTFIEATPDEVHEAAQLATSAFEAYKSYSNSQKATFLKAIAQEIAGLGDSLLDTYIQESGLPRGRAEGERSRTLGQIQAFVTMLEDGNYVQATIDTALPDRTPMPRVDIRKVLVPIGPVAVFGSSNFPLAFSTAGGDTIAALAAGCPVIVKCHPLHAGTNELVASAIITAAQKTTMPVGVFSSIQSKGHEISATLVKHPAIKAVGFTGSIAGGTALYALAANRPEPIPVFAEMGSINPVVLLPQALEQEADKWAASFAGSITLGVGQFCTKPGLILGIKSTYLDRFKNTLTTLLNGQQPACMLHSSMKENFERLATALQNLQEVSMLTSNDALTTPNHVAPAVVTVNGADFLKNTKIAHEVFGPFSVIVTCVDVTELETVIASLEGQLTGTIISTNDEISNYKALIATLQNKVGRLIFNGVPTGVEVCPAMSHGGPFPASTDSRFTAIGIQSVNRWLRPVSFQDWPDALLPAALQNANPLNIYRTVNNILSTNKIS